MGLMPSFLLRMACLLLLVCGSALAAGLEPAQYAMLIHNCPSRAAQASLDRQGRDTHRFHDIRDAVGDGVSLDEYTVDIAALPILPGTSRPATDAEFIEYVRKNFAALLTEEMAKLTPYTPEDGKAWNSQSTAEGALMLFQIKWGSLDTTGLYLPNIGLEEALVVANRVTPMSWQFVTAKGGLMFPGEHPVSGVREFGLRRGPAAPLQFYTRAIDRITSRDVALFAPAVASGQARTWRRLQESLVAFVGAHGGTAAVGLSGVRTASWQADYVATGLAGPGCVLSLSQQESRRAAIATHLLIDQDATGLTGVLAARAAEVLARDPDESTRDALYADIRTLLSRARTAKSPAELLALLDSPEGRRHGLLSRMPAWDPVALAFSRGPASEPMSRNVDALKRAILSGQALADAELQQLAEALVQSTTAIDPAQAVVDATPQEHRATMALLVEVLQDGTPDAARVERLNRDLIALATQEMRKRGEQITAATKASGPASTQPDFMALARGELNSRTLFAASGLVEIAARRLGNPQLANDIAKAQHQVRSAVQLYEGLALLASGGSAGPALAALSLFQAAPGLSGQSDQTAELMGAIADLSALVKREFARVNARLDAIQSTLDQISADLRELKQISGDTLVRVKDMQSQLSGLMWALPRFEQDMKQLVPEVMLSRCHPRRIGQVTEPPDDELFYECLRLYQVLAEQNLRFSAPQSDLAASLIELFPPGDRRPLLDRWPGARVLAKAAAEQLGLEAMRPYADEYSSPALTSGVFLVEGLSGYLDWLDRFGGERFAAGTLRPERDTLERLAAGARQQDQFRQALLPPPGQRAAFMQRFAESLSRPADSAAHDAAAARVLQAARDAVLKYQLYPIINKHYSMSYLPEVSIGPCPGANQGYGPYALGPEAFRAGLPSQLIHFGAVDPGAEDGSIGIYSPHPGLDLDVPMGGLYACFVVHEAQIDGRHNDIDIESHATVEVRLAMGGVQPCEPQTATHAHNGRPYANKPPSPALSSMVRYAMFAAISKCFAGWSNEQKDRWFGGVPDLYLLEGDDFHVGAVLGAAIEDGTLKQSDIAELQKGLAARMSLLRGYLAFAFPEMVANPPRGLDGVFDGKMDPPAEQTAAGFTCLWGLERRRRATTDPWERLRLDEVIEAAEWNDTCGGRRLGLAVSQLIGLREFEAEIGSRLARQFATIAWDTAEVSRLAPTTWVGRRMQLFLDTGMTKEYWDALPPAPRRTGEASPPGQ